MGNFRTLAAASAVLFTLILPGCGGVAQTGGSSPDAGPGTLPATGASPSADAGPGTLPATGAFPSAHVIACNPPPLPAAWSTTWNCPQSLCGNGAVDICFRGRGEQCDGADLAGASCTSLGYPAGTLACDSACNFDARGCETCVANARTSACVHPTLDGVPAESLAITASDTEIGVAWLERTIGPPARPRLHFTRFRPDLTVITDTGCIGPAAAGWLSSIAAVPSGWLVALSDVSGASLLSLDASGAVSQTLPTASGIQFIERRAGAPLLVWGDATGLTHVGRLAADGSALVTDLTFRRIGWLSAVFVGDGFEIATVVTGSPGYQQALKLVHLALDGTVLSDVSIDPMYGTPAIGNGVPGDGFLAWTGSEIRLFYPGPLVAGTQQTLMERIGPDGTLVGDPVSFDGWSTYPVGAAPVLTPGNEAIVAPGLSYGSNNTIDLVRLTPTGTPTQPATLLVRGPVISLGTTQQGGDAIVAWIEGGPNARNGNAADPLVQYRLGIQRVSIAP